MESGSARGAGSPLLHHAPPGSRRMSPHRVVGCWKLVAQVYEDAETGERVPIFGERPRGRQIATADGRWIALATAETRKIPANEPEHVAAMRSMIAYTGRYRVEGDQVVTKVEAAWNEGWVGSEQVRNLRFETDDLLHIVSNPQAHPNLPDRMVRIIVTWQREE
jgi:hypothetical protein